MVTVDWRPPKCWFQPKKKPFKGPLVVTAVKYRCLPQWYVRSVANRLIDSLWPRWTQRLPVVFWNKFALTFKSYINWQCFLTIFCLVCFCDSIIFKTASWAVLQDDRQVRMTCVWANINNFYTWGSEMAEMCWHHLIVYDRRLCDCPNTKITN